MLARSVITIGSFDGVHRGHAALIAAARAFADHGNTGGTPVPPNHRSDTRVIALVFDPHPLTLVSPENAPPRLSRFEDRAQRLRDAGADEVIRLEPTPELLGLSPEAFIDRQVERFAPVAFVEGADFRFGRGRAGDTALLAALGTARHFQAIVLDPVEVVLDDHAIVPASSTLCRWLVKNGRVRDASRVLGRPHSVPGTVVPGDRRGRTIGFPTANIETDVLVPGDGVYAAWAALADGRRFAAAVNVGARPTFAGAARTIEAHLLLDGASTRTARAPVRGLPEYGWSVTLEFIGRLRDQARFAGIDALVAQLHRDRARAAEVLDQGIAPFAAEPALAVAGAGPTGLEGGVPA